MVGYYGQGVPDVENPHTTKYNVSGNAKPGGIRISKLVCFLLIMGALLLAGLSALAVYLLMPYECGADPPPAALTKASIASANPGLVPSSTTRKAVPAPIKLKRIPKDLIPTHYRLKVMPFLDVGNFTTQGHVTVHIQCMEATDKIYLHAVDIDIDRNSIRIKYVAGDYFFRLLDLTYSADDQMYTFHLDRKTKVGEHYHLHMKFVSQLNDLNQGFYRSSYTDRESNKLRWIASTQFSPIDARRAFPCFDEPDFKATFTISVARPNNMTSLANMPRINTEESTQMPGYSWDNYEQTPNMSTYLVAFIVSDLQSYEFNTDGREMKIWSRKDVINQSIYSSTIAPKILKYYEQYFDIKFPLPKLDLVAVPDFGFNGMENWGLIDFRETSLLLDDLVTKIDQKAYTAALMGHELSHQWFGNLVTPKFWDDLWLKEGFSTYFKYRGVHHVEPTWNYSNEFIIEEQLVAMKRDCYSFSRPLSVKIETSNQIREAFDKIAYAKGAAVIHMLQNIYGEEKFKESIKHFLTKYQYRNADYGDFMDAFTERTQNVPGLTSNNLKTIMDTWVTQPGYPVVTAVADYENNTLTLTQKRFYYTPQEDNQLWWIPISYVTYSQPDFKDHTPKIWMQGERETKVDIDLSRGYMLNLENTGYYLVNYDEKNWKQISMNYMNFPMLNRAQVFSNAMDLAQANLLDYDIPFKMLLTLGARDNHYVPYAIAFQKIEYIYNMLLTTPAFTKFNNFMQMVFDHSFDNTMPLENPNDPYEIIRLRVLILKWACKSSESRCVSQSRQLFRALMISNKPIQANLRDTIYCTSIREGGETEFNYAYQLYLNATVPSEKDTLLNALGCTSEPWLLRKYLNMMLDPASGIKKQDGKTVFISVAKNIRGYQIAWQFLRENWEALKAHYGLAFNRLSQMVETLSTYMNSPYDLEQLEAFASSADLATAQRAYNQVYENVKNNVEWMKMCYPSVSSWLDEHSEHFGF